MYFPTLIMALVMVSAAQFISSSGDGELVDREVARGYCPPIWHVVSSDSTSMFRDRVTGQCNGDARAAIHAAFHDGGTWDRSQGNTGGCDGSLILAPEKDRRENFGLQEISLKLLNLAQKRGVGVADMFQFAGAHAIVTCPRGPRIKTMTRMSLLGVPGGAAGLIDCTSALPAGGREITVRAPPAMSSRLQ